MASNSSSPWLPISESAKYISTTHEALKKRCQREARSVGGNVQATLAPGIVARKIGRNWFVQFSAGWWPENDH